jgi:ABC-type Na+ efflux pump permease subunit
MLPFVFLAYGRLLIYVGAFTVRMIIDEQQNNSLSLLRTTPISLRHILYSKASAGVWRQVEDLGLLVIAAALLTLPAIGLQYAVYWPFEEVNLVSRLTLGAGLLASIARLFLEPMMVASMAILVGSVVTQRTQALISLAGLGVFYFILINLPRLLPLPPETRILIDFVLPVALPLVISVTAFQLAISVLKQD